MCFFSIDVYSFLATSSAPESSSGSITELIQESNADITSQGVLSYEYAARVSCVLSQQVDRCVKFDNVSCAPCFTVKSVPLFTILSRIVKVNEFVCVTVQSFLLMKEFFHRHSF